MSRGWVDDRGEGDGGRGELRGEAREGCEGPQ